MGSWNVGTLHAFTGREHARYSVGGVSTRAEVEPLTYYGAARVLNEIDGGRQGLGLISTVVARDFATDPLRAELSGTATVVGVDGWTFLDRSKTWVISGWAAGSRVTGTPERLVALQESSVHYFQRPDATHLGVDPDATALTGYSGRVTLNKQHGNVLMNAAVGALSPGMEMNDLGFGSVSDVINVHAGSGYQWPDPGRLFRRALVLPAVFAAWDFEGNRTWTGIFLTAEAQTLGFWNGHLTAIYNPESMSNRQTRGGPLMLNPAGVYLNGGFDTDKRKRWQVGLVGESNLYERDNRTWLLRAFAEVRPVDRLSINVGPSYAIENGAAQYVDTIADPAATMTYGNRYLFGELDQKTLSADVRINWIFTPKLSFELFAQPLVSSVHYRRIRQLAAPRGYDFIPTEIDPAEYAFIFVSLRGSAVLRWEYRPGSTVYLVWNQNQDTEEDDSLFGLRRSIRALRAARTDTVVMLKASYWWTP